jgi:hypothetical protein
MTAAKPTTRFPAKEALYLPMCTHKHIHTRMHQIAVLLGAVLNNYVHWNGFMSCMCVYTYIHIYVCVSVDIYIVCVLYVLYIYNMI